MKIVMGELNGIRLIDLMNNVSPDCKRVTAAVAYATANNPFFKHCWDKSIFLTYFGLLDEGEAVSVPLLEIFLEQGPLRVDCNLIKGYFHSKIIWWHGYGAYIGSANLTHAAWFNNAECGVFFTENELMQNGTHDELNNHFSYLKNHSTKLRTELVKNLKKTRNDQLQVEQKRQGLLQKFGEATKDIPAHTGFTISISKSKETKKSLEYAKFADEWNKTLELLRGLRNEFTKASMQPSWVNEAAHPTVHFDQFLHAYYYVKIRDSKIDRNKNIKSVELVNRSYLKNKTDISGTFKTAIEWWASLNEAPYGEDIFIKNTSAEMNSLFAKERMATWQFNDFLAAFKNVNAFRSHARQVKNSEYGLPEGYAESLDKRIERLAERLWETKSKGGHTVLELLQFLFWETYPSSAIERLWLVTDKEGDWAFDHLGPSSLGEAIGWARPNDFPPRNNRTNKALRALGHDVELFSSN